MHNEILSDPLSDESKYLAEVSKKRAKSDDDHLEMSRREFLGGLYWNDSVGAVLPSRMIRASILEGAKRRKDGGKVRTALLILEDHSKLEHDGPRSKDELWAKRYFLRTSVGVGGKARVQRTRPMFRQWSAVTHLLYDDSVIDSRLLLTWAEDAGRYAGIGDWRPSKGGLYGRFSVEQVAK